MSGIQPLRIDEQIGSDKERSSSVVVPYLAKWRDEPTVIGLFQIRAKDRNMMTQGNKDQNWRSEARRLRNANADSNSPTQIRFVYSATTFYIPPSRNATRITSSRLKSGL
jgi:hypothetical protein